jgi:hypothetical protein
MREKFKAWAELATFRRAGNAEVQNIIHDKLIVWGINAAGSGVSDMVSNWKYRKRYYGIA